MNKEEVEEKKWGISCHSKFTWIICVLMLNKYDNRVRSNKISFIQENLKELVNYQFGSWFVRLIGTRFFASC